MKVQEGEARSLSRLCRLLGVTRQAYYRHFMEREHSAFSAEVVVQEVLRIRSEQKRIGTRKLHYLLTDFMLQMGIVLGRDRLFDLLRAHGLLVRKRRSRKPRTTFSCYWLQKYPNLARGSDPTAANHLWVADITYIRIGEGFAYLSLLTDAYSRKIVGYSLSRDLTARGPRQALKMALRDDPYREDLIHHSDRGTQYYSRGYLKLLQRAGIRVSMSEKSDPLENAIAERVNGILKEEFLSKRFSSFIEADKQVHRAVSIYNHQRPHLSIDLLTPAEAHRQTRALKRHWKNYYSLKQTPISSQAMA
jgi:putative transposase